MHGMAAVFGFQQESVLTDGLHLGQGLVQDQHRGVVQHRAGDGDGVGVEDVAFCC